MAYNSLESIDARIEEIENRLEQIPDEILAYFENDDDAFADVVEALDSWDGFLYDDRYYSMDEFDDLMYGLSPTEIAEKVEGGDFCTRDDYFRFTIYGIESTDSRDYSDYLDADTIEKIIDERGHLDYAVPEDVDELLDEMDALNDELDELIDERDNFEEDTENDENE